MFSHVTVGTNNIEASIAFYDRVMATIGHSRHSRGETWAAYGNFGDVGIDVFWILRPIDGKPATYGNGTNVAFLAPSRKAVDEFYAMAIELGGIDEGKPGIREDDHPNFYAAYVRDLDGNKLVVVCHWAPEEQ